MSITKLPPLVRKGINQLAHRMALVEEARLHRDLTKQALEVLAAGKPAAGVLALLSAQGQTT
jgi:hypothetical protein